MTTHSNILAWKIPWTEEPGGLHSPWGCTKLAMIERLSTFLDPSLCALCMYVYTTMSVYLLNTVYLCK